MRNPPHDGGFVLNVRFGYAVIKPAILHTGEYVMPAAMPVIRRMRPFCRACGAPSEPDACSYCLTPTEYET